MSGPKPQSPSALSARKSASRGCQCLGWALVALLTVATTAFAADAAAGTDAPPSASIVTAYPAPEGRELFGIDSPLGRVEYRAGRGLRVGKTGLTIGGFATAGAEILEGGDRAGGLEGVNFLLSYDPFSHLHIFSELEVAEIAESESGREGVRSGAGVEVNRLYADLGWNDLLNLRFGQFFTPIGRWSPAPIEPLVWTTSEPLIVEEVFDDTSTGAMLWGTFFPRGGALSYSLYGTFLDTLSPDREAPTAEHSAGARLEWTSLGGWSVGTSYFASKHRGEAWNHLGGVDGLWRPHERVELSGEAVFGEGTRADGGQWGLFAQAVVETFPTIYLVGRYERFDPPETSRGVDLFDVGVAWVPVYYLRLKADYLFADHLDDHAAPGFRMSISVIF